MGEASNAQLPSVWWYDVGPRYFATLGLPLTAEAAIYVVNTEDDMDDGW